MKKILALMLSAMLLLCMMPSMAFAETQTSIAQAQIGVEQSSYEYTGSAIEPKVTVTLNGTTLTKGVDYTATYSNNIDVAAKDGSAPPTVTITGKGNYSGTITATFTITQKDINRAVLTHPDTFPVDTTIDDVNFILKNGTTTLSKGTDYTIAFEDQTQTKVRQGAQNVIITGQNNYKGARSIRIEGGTDIKNFIVDAIKDVVYNGSPQRPSVVVRSALGASALSTSNYDVTYSNNTNAGTATVTITGKNGYAGTLTSTFIITPKSITRATVSAIENQAINGTPEPVVYDGNNQLKLGTDYTLSYKNYEQKGTATVFIHGVGNYKDEIAKAYQVKDSLSPYAFSLLRTTYEYTGNTIKPEVLVTASSKYREGIDYKLVYDTSSKVETNKKVQVVGIGNYGGIVTEFSYSITPKALSNTTATVSLPANVAYNGGKAIEPAVSVSVSGRTLTKDTDYTVTYLNNTKIGTATVYIYGIGNYSGSIYKTFKILGQDIAGFTATLSQTSYQYTGTEHKPTVTLYHGTTKLTNNIDYKVSYKNNKNSGTATAVIEGIGNYSGTKNVNFTIIGKEQELRTDYTYYTKYLTSSNFNLNATTTGDGVILYESSDPSVATVSPTGVVSIHNTGKAVITVKTSKDIKFNPEVKYVYVTVKPKKPPFKLTSPAKKQAKVTITKVDGATKYQVRYGRMGSYNYKYVAHKNNGYKTTYVTLKNLKRGAKYYIKVRSYKTLADGTKVWGNWTTVKTIKVK